MREPRRNVISTVGVSLIGNVRREGQSEPALEQLVREQRWKTLGEHLVKKDPADRILGAELNSLAQLAKRKDVKPSSIWFMMSDTDDAKTTEEILTGYFCRSSWHGIKPSNIHFVYVEDLQDKDPGRFRTRGLRNLVREMAKIIRERGPNSIAIDATGGYKAQVALAVALGQAMNIPVYYRHDRFSYIIELPPMPITFDYDVLGRNAWLLQRLENNGTADSSEIEPVEDKIKVLLQDTEIDGQVLWELSPIGFVYLAGYRQMVYSTVTLPESKGRKPPELPKHHLPNGFFPFAHKIWTENDWISRIVYLESGEKKGTQPIRFFTKESEQGQILMGDYFSDFGARFRIHISSEEPQALTYAAMTLNDRYVR